MIVNYASVWSITYDCKLHIIIVNYDHKTFTVQATGYYNGAVVYYDLYGRLCQKSFKRLTPIYKFAKFYQKQLDNKPN